MIERVAVVQLTSTQDVEANMNAIKRFVQEAAEAGAQLVALPENACFLRHESTASAPIQPLDGALVGRLRAIAGEHGIWLLVGSFPEQSSVLGKYYNTSLLIDGTQAQAPITAAYRKLHLFDVEIKGGTCIRESDWIVPGEEIMAADAGGLKLGLTICYDLRFPDLYQWLTHEAKVRAVSVPAAFTEFTGKDHWLALLKARAIETQCFVIAPNQVGHHGGSRRSFGKSVIYDPWGTPLCIVPDRPGWAMARLDYAHQDTIRASLPCLIHRHPAVP
jgi:predicted amidohydrolase